MDPLLQRHCAKYIYAVPEGLKELMSDISREVLRGQPEQLYTFIADYLDALLITRENARVAARLIEVIIEIGKTIVEFLLRTGLTRAEADVIVTKIQTGFRNHLAAKKRLKLAEETIKEEQEFMDSLLEEIEVPDKHLDDAARIIQRAYHQFKERESREKDLLRGIVDWRVAAKSTINLYRKTGVTFAEANRAATLIKAAYKGYYTRRVMRRLLEQGTNEYIESMEELPAYEEAEELVEGEEEWGWCYCFVEEENRAAERTHPVSEETPSNTVVTSVMSSIIKSVIPSLEVLETIKIEERDHIKFKEPSPEEVSQEETMGHPQEAAEHPQETVEHQFEEKAEHPPEETTTDSPESKEPDTHPAEEAVERAVKDVEHLTAETGLEVTHPPAEPAPEVEKHEEVSEDANKDTEHLEHAKAEGEEGHGDATEPPAEPDAAEEVPAETTDK